MWRRRHRKPEPESERVRRAREAAQRAAQQRREVEAQWPAVEEISGALRNALKVNHLGEGIQRAFSRRGAT